MRPLVAVNCVRVGLATRPVSMDHDVVFRFEFEMRDVEIANRVQRRCDGAVGLRAGVRGTQLTLNLAQRTQDPGTVEALSLTMFAEAHRALYRLARRTRAAREWPDRSDGPDD